MQKPDGLVVIQQEELPERLYSLELRDLCGIGKNMEERLHRYGIFSVKSLCLADQDLLREVWGGYEGERMYARLRGEAVWHPVSRKTCIGHSHVLAPEKRHDQAALAVLDRLLQKAFMRLRKEGYLARALHLGLKYEGRTRWSDDFTFQETQDTLEGIRFLKALWKRRPARGGKIIAVSVTLFNLVAENNHTLSLFAQSQDRKKLNAIMDKLNKKFGKDTLYYGGAFDALQDAPLRIAFNHIPDLELEGE
jgi:DNA polymerase IV